MRPSVLAAAIVLATTCATAAAEPVAAPPALDASAFARRVIANGAERDRHTRLAAAWTLIGVGVGLGVLGLIATRTEDDSDKFIDLSPAIRVIGWVSVVTGASMVITGAVAKSSRRPI